MIEDERLKPWNGKEVRDYISEALRQWKADRALAYAFFAIVRSLRSDPADTATEVAMSVQSPVVEPGH